jgi:hypothetical protein
MESVGSKMLNCKISGIMATVQPWEAPREAQGKRYTARLVPGCFQTVICNAWHD